MELWKLHQGNAPLIVDVPHAGLHVPDAIALRLTPAAQALPDTDWHVDELYAFARAADVTLLVATHSRYVIDLNRDPSGAALYPGADNTELCPTFTFDRSPIYVAGAVPDGIEIAARRAIFHAPYHARLAREVSRLRERHGYTVLLDGHSIPSEVPRFFSGRLPDLNLGTADGASCDAALATLATSITGSTPGFTLIVNGRFKGGYITRHFGRPVEHVHALQLEIAQSAYLDEADPRLFDPARAARLANLLERLVVAMSEWRPQMRKR
jgi:N-formylglutamate amidohydrolase